MGRVVLLGLLQLGVLLQVATTTIGQPVLLQVATTTIGQAVLLLQEVIQLLQQAMAESPSLSG